MNKKERLKLIAKTVEEHELKTQDELVSFLLNKNIEVTQATISRDIKNLGLIKIPASTGGFRYSLVEKKGQNELVQSAVLSAEIKETMVALQARPGTTSLIKHDVMDRFEKELFSCLIDDDSILIIAWTSEDALKIYESFNSKIQSFE